MSIEDRSGERGNLELPSLGGSPATAVTSTRKTPQCPIQQQETMDAAISFLQMYRSVDPMMPVQTALTFMLIARHKSTSAGAIQEWLEISQPATSRCLSSLASWSWRKKDGLALIRTRADKMDQRKKIISLTSRGEGLRDRLVSAIWPAHLPN